jgi:AcrR family transcriptional regulator
MDTLQLPRMARRKLATRQRIVREAIELFGRQGFDGTKIEDIVVRADVAKGTFFNYFPRKEALLTHLIEQRLSAAVANTADLLRVAIPVRDKLLDLYAEAASGHEEDAVGTRALLAEEATRVLSPASLDDLAARWSLLVRGLVDQGLRSGEIRRGLKPAQAALVLNAVYTAVLRAWAGATPGTYDLRAEIRAHVLMVMDGFAAL